MDPELAAVRIRTKINWVDCRLVELLIKRRDLEFALKELQESQEQPIRNED